MAGVLIASVLAIVALAGIVLYVVREQARKHDEVDRELHDAHAPTLEYAVPLGVDPVVLVAALEQAGYSTTVDARGGPQLLLVKCPRGADRERDQVRSVLESADNPSVDHEVPLPTQVRFRDEG